MFFLHKNIVNLYIIYKLDTYFRDLKTDFTLNNRFWPAEELSKIANPGRCGYSDYVIGFHAWSQIS